ncbi:unnamed protein product [Schistosoma bovis]|nr:unnamed protein product [Schistosoma bovis]CAH8454835.1 unnamed protein product [Schistosoma bovis]
MSSQVKEDLYGVSWSNPAWSHFLCSANVLDYFCDLSNPFYDRQCNNEVIRMQRLHPEQLLCMTGVEFYLHHAQEPILFIIRKQQRLSPTQVTPLAYYYVINGTVLQAPDLSTLLNSRLLTAIVGLKKVIQASSGKEENLQNSCNSPAKLPTRLPTLPGVSVVPGPSPSTSTQPSLLVDRKPRV